MKPETRRAMEMLYEAKINLPDAAKSCNLTHKECKIVFNAYCELHPPSYQPSEQVKN